MKVFISTSKDGTPKNLKSYVKLLKSSYPEFEVSFDNFEVSLQGDDLDDLDIVNAIIKTLKGKGLPEKAEVAFFSRLGLDVNNHDELLEELEDRFSFDFYMFRNKDGDFILLADEEGILITTKNSFKKTYKF